ncbi:MAG TPA: bifunctional DNA primase/polymerase [Pilimelia sp.]|nr:bifunctional DNA primase/polymerase [Pilimelia sp.]
MSDLLGPALDYAGRGWPVFMLGRTRRPVANCRDCPRGAHDPAGCAHLTCHGFYAATTDPDRITALIHAVPRGVLAIRTGTPSGLAVVDIDPRNGGTLLPDLMPPTACVRTGGGGWHLYYRHPGVPLAAKVAGVPGVDIKSDGGYVVAPPSIHPDTGRAYQWVPSDRDIDEMPPSLLTACRPRTAAPARHTTTYTPATTSPTTPGGGRISYPHRLLAALIKRVDTAPAGTRRTTLYGCARGGARIVAAHQLDAAAVIDALTEVGRRVGQPERDITAAIRGGFQAEGVPL